MAEISLLLVDDHPVVRNGLRGMFEAEPGFTVLAEASNGVEAVALAAELDPDVILMDLRMPGGGGLDAITELTRRGARAKVLVLTTWDTDTDTLPAIEAGATGYLLKDAPQDELFTGVREAAAGRTVLSLPSPPGWSPLSGRRRRLRWPPVNARSSHWLPKAPPIARSPASSSSARRRSRPTSVTCSPSSA